MLFLSNNFKLYYVFSDDSSGLEMTPRKISDLGVHHSTARTFTLFPDAMKSTQHAGVAVPCVGSHDDYMFDGSN